MTHDLIIIGGGIAGLSTAVQAVDNGLTPLVLEKGEGPDYPCNARWSGGVIHVAEKDMRAPKEDIVATLPVGFCAAAAHSAGVFCLGADPLFGQIVKAGEPVLSAFVNTVFYGKPPSIAKVFCLFFIVGGVGFASLKKAAADAASRCDCLPHFSVSLCADTLASPSSAQLLRLQAQV